MQILIPNMKRFIGRTALVTGAARGIGRAIAERLAIEGATVALIDINKVGLNDTVRSIGGNCFGVQADVSNQDSVEEIYTTVINKIDGLDILINSAAIIPYVSWKDLSFDEWRRVLSVNLDGVFLMCKGASEHMKRKKYGRIVNIASNAIYAGIPNMSHYLASKGGVLTFSRALATELGDDKITVNAVCPGLTNTEGVQETHHKKFFDYADNLQAVKGTAVPVDIVPAVVFLASEEAHWITGQSLSVDAGLTKT